MPVVDDDPPRIPGDLYLTIRGGPSAPSGGPAPTAPVPVGPTPAPDARAFFPTPGRERDEPWVPAPARPLRPASTALPPLPAPGSPTPEQDRYFPPPQDPLTDALRQMQASPTEARAIQALQAQTGLPPAVIQRHQAEIRQGLAATQFDPLAFRQRTPKLAQWLTERPERMPAVQDDLPALQRVEDTVTFGESILNGIDTWRGGAGAFLEAGAELFPAEWGPTESGVGALGKRWRMEADVRQAARGQGQAFSAIRGPGGLWDWGKQQVGAQIPIMGTMMAGAYAGALAGSVVPGIGTTIGGLVGAFLPALVLGVGGVQQEVKQIDPEAVASGSVWLGGTAVAAFDTALPGHIGSKLVSQFGKATAEEIAKRALLATVKPTWLAVARKGAITGLKEEVIPEILQEAIGAVAAAHGTGTPVDPNLGWRMLEAGAGAALVGPLAEGGTELWHLRRQQHEYVAARQQQLFFETLGTGVADSKLLKELPQAMAEYLQSATAEGPIPEVFIPTEPFATYFTGKGVNPDLMAEALTGSRTALADARRDGVDLVVPTAKYATIIAPSEDGHFFIGEVRLRENVKNLREVEAEIAAGLEAAKTAEADALAAVPAERHARLQEARDVVYARVEAQALAGGASARVAASWAQMEAAAFVGIASRLELDPFDVLERRGPVQVVTSITPTTEAGVAGPATIPASEATPGETGAQRATRETAHLAALGSSLLRAARAIDPTVNEADLRAELAYRVAAEQEQQSLARESGMGQDFLRAIAGYGGLWWETRTGAYKGEVEDLIESGRDIRGVAAGSGRVIHEPGRATYAGVPGVFREEGLPPDQLLRSLRQEGRFARIETLNDFWTAIDDALRAAPDVDRLPGTEDLRALGIDPATAWWTDRWRPPDLAPEAGAEPGLAGEPNEAVSETDLPDQPITFAPEEFEQGRPVGPAELAQTTGPDLAALEAALPPLPATHAALTTAIQLQTLQPQVAAEVAAKGKLRVRPLKQFLQKTVRAAARALGLPGVGAIDPSTPTGHAALVHLVVREVLAALGQGQNAVGWYDRKISQARAVLTLLYPEFATDRHAWFAFTYALAVTSNGLPAAGRNFELAETAYRTYQRTGRMPTDIGEGKAAPQINEHLERFNAFVARMGVDGFRTFLTTPTTVGALNALGYQVSGERVTQAVYGAAMLGPKIGNGFFMNLHGVYDQLTMDRWFVRAWQRWVATLIVHNRATIAENRLEVRAALTDLFATADLAALQAHETWTALLGLRQPLHEGPYTDTQIDRIGYAIFDASQDPAARVQMNKTVAGVRLRKGGNTLGKNLTGERESPRNPERPQMRAVIAQALAALHAAGYTALTIADLQAVLWYPEKRLYEAASREQEIGSSYQDGEAPDYANAAANLAQSRGIPARAIQRALDAGARQSAAAAGRAGGTERAGGGGSPTPPAGRAGGAQPVGAGLTPAAAKLAAARTEARTTRVRRRGEEFRQEVEPSSWHDPAFYSRLTQAVEASTLQRASGAQWKATIRNAKTGISQDEFVYAHVEDLEDGRTYTRPEVLDYLAANQLRPQYVTLREAMTPTTAMIDARADAQYEEDVAAEMARLEEQGYEVPSYEAAARYNEEEEAWEAFVTVGSHTTDVGHWYASEAEALAVAEAERDRLDREATLDLRRVASSLVDYDVIRQQAEEELQADAEDEASQLRYGQFQMPGPREPGSAREVFLTAPAVQGADASLLPGLSEAEVTELRDLGYPFTVSEVGQALADRNHDRAVALVQTAIDQAGALPTGTDAFETTRARARALLQQLDQYLTTQWRPPQPTWRDGHSNYDDVENPIVRLRYNIRTLADGRRMLFLEELQPPHPDEFAKMPRLLQKQWRELGLKWAIATATELKLDLVGWTPGQVQADRYNLATVVDRVEYYPESQQLAAYIGADETLREYRVAPAALPRYVGQAVAEKLLAQAPTRGAVPTFGVKAHAPVGPAQTVYWSVTRDGDMVALSGLPSIFNSKLEAEAAAITARAAANFQHNQSLRHSLSGPDLVVGGEGLKRLYDKDLPAVANSLPVVKRNGSRVGTVELPGVGDRLAYIGPEPTEWQLREINLGNSHVADGAGLVLQAMQLGQTFARSVEGLPSGTAGALAERVGGRLEVTSSPVPALSVTPGMVAEIGGKGQALFQTEGPGEGAPPAPGQVRGAYNPVTNTIRLTQAANLSTFLHEAGHQFLEDLLFADTLLPATEARTAPQQQLGADVRTALRAIGFQGTPEEWRTLDVEARRPYHEHFADAFLLYLEEGTAPDPELRTLFRRFRAWLSGLIHDITARGISVSPELRGVFDRLLASDAAIARARAEAEVTPLLTDAASAGVSPEQFAAYQAQVAEASAQAREEVDRAVMAEWRREQRADWEAQRVQVRAAVAEEFNDRPAFVAQSVIRTGLMPDGSVPSMGDGTPIKLSKADLVRSYGPGILAQLPKPYLYTVEGGIPVETAAELFGFGSGDALLEALQVTPPTQRAIETETDTRMREQLGEPPLEGPALDAVAERAVQSHRAAVISAELAALTKGMAGATITPAAQLKAAAEAQVRDMTVRQVKPGLYLEAMRRASKQAFDAWATNDRAAAIAAKQRELTALALYRATRDAQDRVQVERRQLQKYAEHPATRARLGRAGGDYLEQIDALLDRFGFTTQTGPALKRAISLRAWIAKIEAQGLPINLPEDVVDQARAVNYQELTVGELADVYDTAQAIAHLARTKDRLLTVQRQRTVAEISGDLATSIREQGTPRPKTLEPRVPGVGQVLQLFRGLNAAHRKLANVAYALDGYRWGGPVWTYIINPLNQAANASATMNAAATEAGHALFERYSLAERRQWFTKLHIPALGPATDPRASITKQGRLLVALNWGNETNRQRVRDGHGWTEAQAQAVLDTLDEKDWQFVQGMWDWINSYWPAIAAKQERVYGLAPEQVQPVPVFTKYGMFPGGYFPIKFEGALAATPGSHEEGGLADLQKLAAYVGATTARGHTKARADGDVTIPVRLDFGVVQEHLGQVIHDLTHHETLVDVGRLLRDEGVQQAIYDVAGRETYDLFKQTLRDIALGDTPARNTVEKVVNHIRVGVTTVGLGFNVVNTIINLLGVTQSMYRIGPTWVGKGLTQWLGSPASMKRAVEEVHARSALMRERDTQQSRDIRDVLTDVGLKRGPVSLWVDQVLGAVSADKLTKQAIVESYFRLQQTTQLWVDMVTFLGAEQKALADPTTRAEDGTIDVARAVALAEQEVLSSQGGGSIKDLATIQRGNAWLKLYTTFYSFFSTTYNNWADSLGKTRALHREGRNAAALGELITGYTLVILLPAVLSSVFMNLLRGEDDGDELLTDAIIATGAYMLGTMVLLRELGGAVQGFTHYEGPTGLRSIGDLSTVIQAAGKGKIGKQAVQKAIGVVGTLAHLPTGQAWRSYEGFMALLEGRTENPLALVTGPPRREPRGARR